MFSIHDRPTRLCDRIDRRELIRIGGLSCLGLSLPDLWRREAGAAPAGSGGGTFGRAKNVIFLWLQGGPPQHETFDPKPDAPAEIRGPFRPIATNVPGIHFCELLPRTAAIADKLAVVRSISTNDNTHDSSGYWILTGYKYEGVNSREIKPTDWPYFGSIVKMLKPSGVMPPLTSVWIPDLMRLNDNVQPAGQTGGFLGRHWDPERFVCDPSAPGFQLEGLAAPADLPPLRLSERVRLLDQVQRHFDFLERGATAWEYDQIQRDALGLLTSGRAREAFAIDEEPDRLRERYGRHKWGQCVLLARRLIEAGVRLVHVNWAREPGDTAVDNPMWDTHAQNADRLQDVLCPQFDVGFTALVGDLDERGLLDETLVVAIGEFGRTPKINDKGGRDHWGPVFSFALAGAGIRGGQVYGASDKTGAFPASNPVQPSDLVATIFHLLGIDHQGIFPDRFGRLLPLSKGEPIYELLGTAPATLARAEPGGDIALVPPYDPSPLLNGDFEAATPLHPVGGLQRTKGWHALPLGQADSTSAWAVQLVREAGPASRSGRQHVVIGLGIAGAANAERKASADGGTGGGQVAEGARAMLTQEVRSPRAGRYTFSIHASAVAGSADYYRDVFLKSFAIRLVIFGYTGLKKDPRQVREFASARFEPALAAPDAAAYERYEVSATLRSQDGGAFETSLGVGVAVVVEQTAPVTLELGQGAEVSIRLDDAELVFNARPRDDTVKV